MQAHERDWGADVLVFRSCGGEMNRAPRTYHSGETTDLDFVVGQIRTRHPTSPIVLCGVSLGGNVLLKWLGEQGDRAAGQVVAAAVISVPFDLARACAHIDISMARMYSRHFLRSLRRKALSKIAQHPSLADADAVRRSNTLWSFDDAFTSLAHGFRDAADYYAQSSALRFLSDIRVPTLLLSARDDPFHPPELLEEVEHRAQENPYLVCEFHDRGGHVGFVGGAVPWRPEYYGEKRAVEFLAAELAALPSFEVRRRGA
jgi:predicted alpha/beta-fold hydrolase